ncbi:MULTISPECIES: GlsB/YeaQ/YmgE family stress response membrane protein [unclassified Polaribacter]|uniref:GlsB/YeaQ/YmgE family stress response membrane protein n=1 Tax=unclassified Polaribacter TaxID=196858 RepID=UPI0011BDDFE2|nr:MULTISPECIES: GlsB/YeaQ/YmgE family stress response membrane protein [unclassified Polaribacter]TXD51818.1 GlsB/YeaQ/YmgE family stress response membrane protein [Polaribacter sp. IC063]TXD59180.1 GlsB/YeaQ/YmgE family stress response membrane protein [Polaribacter sp. IC066]
MGILYTIIIGAICGYIADVLMRDNGFGLVINIIIGIAGSFVGTWAFGKLGINVNVGYPILNDIIVGASGAVLILFIVGIFKSGGRRR